MSKNLVINGVTYNGIESMGIPNTEGEEVIFIPEDEAGAKLPELTNPAGDEHIAYRREAYDQEGNLLVGTAETVHEGYTRTAKPDIVFDEDWGELYITETFKETAFFEAGATNQVVFSGDDLGDAAAEDVAAGKTFTSAAGLKVVGTAVASGGSSVFKYGSFTTDADATTITVPDVGTECNKLCLICAETAYFTTDTIIDTGDLRLVVTNMSASLAALYGSYFGGIDLTYHSRKGFGVKNFAWLTESPITFNADGTASATITDDYLLFPAGLYIWFAWKE